MPRSNNLKGIWNSIDNLLTKPPGDANLWEQLGERADFASSRPEAASGIVVSKLESNRTGEYYILKNPRAGTYLKLTSRDFYLWNLMDGTRSVKDLVMTYISEYGTFPHVVSLVTQLRNNFFLTEQPINTFDNLKRKLRKGTSRHKTDVFWRSFLNKQFSFRQIDRYVSRAYKAVGWIFFTKPMNILYLLILVLGAFFFIRQLNSGSYSILRTWQSYGLGFLTVLIIYIGIAFVHETAHAFAVKSYGRDIRKAGFMIYFGMPAFFVDTMDIWMEPRRSRIIVSWAGPYSQLIFGGMSSIVAVLFPGTLFGSLLFKFSFFSYLLFFVNLNPLLEMDGYFVFIDWLDVTLLRRRSLGFVRNKLWSKILQREQFDRDEKLFAVFGILTGIWSVCAISIAVYLWQQRLFGALAGFLEKSLVHKLYLSVVILVFGVPLLVVLAIKLKSLIQDAFVWMAENKYLKNNNHLIVLLVVISIFLAVISYLTPTAHSADRLQIYKEIFKLMILIYALIFAIINAVCYREGRLGRTFQFLAASISLIFAADLLAVLSVLSVIQSELRTAAYALLLISTFLLSIKDISLCHWSEKVVTLFLLTVSCWLAFMAIVGRIQSDGWQVSLIPIFDFLFPMMLVSLAFVLLLPSCFVYRGTELRTAWLVLASSLIGMSIANALSFYENLATSFHILGYSLLASALFGHYIIHKRVRFAQMLPTGEVALRYDDKSRLRCAFVNICEAMLSQLTFMYGERIAQDVQDRLNTRAREAGWKLKAVDGKVEDEVPQEFNIISLGEIYRGFLSQALDFVSGVTGSTFVEKVMERGIDRLYWEEREIAYEYLISPLKHGRKLTEEFRITKEHLLNTLNEIAIFSGLSQQELLLISSRLQMEKFRRGTDIVKQGDVGDKFYIIESGAVEVAVLDDTNGIERVVAHLSQGDYFGEIALLGEVPRTATCRATTSVRVWALDKRDFSQLVRSNLDLPEKLDRAVANMTMLKRMPLFRELTYKQINMISSMLESRTVPARTVIIREGEQGDAFYIIKSGEVMVTAGTETGERTVGIMGEAEYFGEIALITNQPRMATVKSVSETELLILEKRDFGAVVQLISSDLEQAGSRRMLDTRRKLGTPPPDRKSESGD